MANETYLRGDVYWICLDDSIGAEEMTGRPAVIVSADGINEKEEKVVVAFLTKQSFSTPHRPTVDDPTSKGTKSRVLCDQLRTVDKKRLTRYMWSLSAPELVRVTGALACTLCIPTPKNEIKTEPSLENDTTSLRCEADMWRRLYEKTMDQLVELKMTNDLANKMSEPKKEPVEVTTPPTEPENTRVEINTCTVEDLMKCGCTLSLARLIVSYRPYKTVGDLTRVPGLRSTAFQILKHKVCCTYTEEVTKPKMVTPPAEPKLKIEVKKVDINTATAGELMEALGIGKDYAYAITGYRNRNGRFVELEEIKEVSILPKSFYDKYKDHLTIGEETAPAPAASGLAKKSTGKVNVNLVETASELTKLTGMCSRTTSGIINYRNEHGKFASVEDLLKTPAFGAIAMKRYGHLLEV